MKPPADNHHRLADTATPTDIRQKDGPSPGRNRHIIAVVQKGVLVGSYRPAANHVTIGRSGKCTIQLPHPAFPRHAGEILLGPASIFRKRCTDTGKMHITPLSMGRAVKIHPYRIYLLEKGDILINRRGRPPGKPARGKVPTCLWTASLFLLVAAFTRINLVNGLNPAAGVAGSGPVIGGENITEEVADFRRAVETSVQVSETNAEPQRGGHRDREPDISEVVTAGKIRMKNTAARHSKDPSMQDTALSATNTLPDEQVDILLRGARRLIDNGKLEEAGRTILPLLPHLGDRHKQVVTTSVEEALRPLFQEACLLRPYDRQASDDLLKTILSSNLTFLPSYIKSREVLQQDARVKKDWGSE